MALTSASQVHWKRTSFPRKRETRAFSRGWDDPRRANHEHELSHRKPSALLPVQLRLNHTRTVLVTGEFGVRSLATALQRGNSPQTQLAAPKLVARLWTAQYPLFAASAELERQQAGVWRLDVFEGVRLGSPDLLRPVGRASRARSTPSRTNHTFR